MSFDQVLGQALASIQGAEMTNQFKIDKKKKLTETVGNVDDVKAQATPFATGVNQAALQMRPETLNQVPFQIFLDKIVGALVNVSEQEFKVNDLIERFVQGQVTEDEVIIETAKFNLIMSMIVSIVQSAIQEFKTIQQIPI
ncbi:hypothetical protein DID77_04845 [Candidatus Marinamargulisbacteria bacterium SCGC AG-439-L15]|nr:hypothetical protein DID77_04845 [Candidatus Marinamargulisbacteria bacterium SCGC AG-439-L15]